MQDEEMRATPYARLWLDELGGTVPEVRRGEPGRRRRRPDELVREDRATAGAVFVQVPPGGRA